jgi:branched-chain amino acid transport system permease protein
VRARKRTLIGGGGAAVLAAAAALYLGAPIYVLFVVNLLMTYAVLAIGLDVLLGRAGQFAFAHIAFYGIGIYTAGLITNHTGIPVIFAIIAGGALAGIVGTLIAIPATRLHSVYLALATFAFAEAAQWVFNNWDSVTKGPNGLRIKSAHIFGFLIQNDRDAFPLIFAIAAVMIAATALMARSQFGRAMEAVRESEHVALASGISVQRVKISAFAVSAVYAGIAGGMFTLFQSFIHPDSLGFDLIVLVLTMVVVGGLGSLTGVILGVVLLGLMPEVLRNFREWQELIYGVILILAVVFMPRGIWGLIVALRPAPKDSPPPAGTAPERAP